MSNNPKTMDISPNSKSSKMAILAITKAKHETARRISNEVRKTYEALSRNVEPDVEPDQEQVEPNPQASLQLASLGVELALKEKEAIRLERDVVIQEQDASLLKHKLANKRLRDITSATYLPETTCGNSRRRRYVLTILESRAESLHRAGNALLMSHRIKGWFDSYQLVVVPFDSNESPITRWRTDVLSSDINNMYIGSENFTSTDLNGKELQFLNEKRPVSRFLYFHFIMTLVRIKDTQRRGWEDIWARYYEQRPFPTPGNYMRKSMLLALATHFETADMNVVDSWIKDHGFDTPLKLTDEEATEAARRVHLAVEDAIACAEKSESQREERSEESGEERSEESSEEDFL
ncbi:hypothetical protein CMQ_5540 [Grosmannia clavigera kw1407]|uniref:Uncharacterized protein n=1 Tax=Grosmannia clavigera (strain kw1407 / UAMH 11150) TaxID=655863 RepID=F0XSZ5_GROCL|nr:uncharacterized protein CMQ_5540 [Grosmannia clavigera kw1407]EFW99119.1 hypothetical protein CMQ_5540 [Grosmannia clavigera kw1407]